MPDPVTAPIAPPLSADEPQTAAPKLTSVAAPKAQDSKAQDKAESAPKPAHPAPAALPALAVNFEALNEVLYKAQEVARETGVRLADSQLQAATSFLDLQQKLLEMAHANVAASFAAAQRIVTSPDLGSALAAHRHFAQEQVSRVTQQVSELRSLSSKARGEATNPVANYWTQSFDLIRKSFGR